MDLGAKSAQKRVRLFTSQEPESINSCSFTPVSQKENDREASKPQTPLMVARIGEQLDTSFQVHEQPTEDSSSVCSVSASTVSPFSNDNSSSDASVLVRHSFLVFGGREKRQEESKV